MDTKSHKRQKTGSEVEQQRSNAKTANEDDDSVYKSVAIDALFQPATFSDVPATVLVSNVFQYIENRTDWNNFSLVNKEIKNSVTNHKNLVPPWPENCRLWHLDGSLGVNPSHNLMFSPNGDCVAFCESGQYPKNDRIHVGCRKKGLFKSWEDDEIICSLAYSLDNKLLLSCNFSGLVKYWDATNDYRCIEEMTVELNLDLPVDTAAFSHNRQFIATDGGSEEQDFRTVYLWRVSDGSKIREINIEMTTIMAIQFSPDGKTVAVGGLGDNDDPITLGIWMVDHHTEDFFISLDGHTNLVNNFAFSPDGKYLASASDDKTIKLWEFPNQRCVKTLTGHTDNRIASISFSSCGNFLVSGGWDNRNDTGTLRTWNVATGTCLHSMNAVGPVRSVKFSDDGRTLLTSEGRQIRLRSTAKLGLGER
jgi:WD40 repeat protein